MERGGYDRTDPVVSLPAPRDPTLPQTPLYLKPDAP